MKNENRIMFKSVTASLIAGAILIVFLEPILKGLWNYISVSSNSILVEITNSNYSNAALGIRNWLDFITISLGLIVLSFVYIQFITRKIIRIQSFIEEENEKELSEEELQLKYENKINRFSKVKRLINKTFPFLKWTSFLIVFPGMLLIGTHFVYKAYVDMQLNASFQQRITILAPCLEIEQEEELKAHWAQMKNKEDFENIQLLMESYADSCSIDLPPNLLK